LLESASFREADTLGDDSRQPINESAINRRGKKVDAYTSNIRLLPYLTIQYVI